MSEFKKGELCYFWNVDGEERIKAKYYEYLESYGIHVSTTGEIETCWQKCISVKDAEKIKIEAEHDIKLADFIAGLEDGVKFLKQKIDAKEHLLSMIREQISDE